MTSRQKLLTGLLITFLFACAYIALLGERPLIIPDETRYGEIPREMLANGSWLSPKLDGMPYFEKPAPAYWPAMISMKAFGDSHFSIRLPYALATGVSALMVFLLARRGRKGGKDEEDDYFPFLATAVFLSMAEVFGIGTFAVLDPLLAMLITGTMLAFYCAWTERSSMTKRQLFMLLAGVLAGGAFMVKGFLGILLPGAAIGAFLLWMRDWKSIFTLPWAALLGALAVALPWVVMQHRAEPDFWHYFIMVEHFGRFAGEGAERHPQPFWFYIPVLLGGMMPFTIYAYSLARGGSKLDWKEPFHRFLAAWIAIPLIALSLSSGKLGTYILPLFPALALLTLLCLKSSFESFGSRSLDIATKCFAWLLSLGALLALALPLAFYLGIALELRKYEHSLLGAGCFLFISAIPLYMAPQNSFGRTIKNVCCAAFLLANFLWNTGTLKPLFEDSKAPESFIVSNAKSIPSSMKVVASSDLAGAVCWSLKRDNVEIFRKTGEFDYGMEKSGRKLIEQEQLRSMLEAEQPKEGLAIFIPQRLVKKCLADLKGNPERKLVYANSGDFACVILPPK